MEKYLWYLLPILSAFVYKILEYYGFWNFITGRKYALKGVERLKSGKGYPSSWIFNDEKDKIEFNALYRRIVKKTKNDDLKKMITKKQRPSLITIGGSPIEIRGVVPEWPLEQRISYIGNYPVMLVFGVPRIGGKGSGVRACSLEDLERWIDDEKRTWDFWAGVVVLSVLSIVIMCCQIALGI